MENKTRKIDIKMMGEKSAAVYVDGEFFKKFSNFGLAWAHAVTIVDFLTFCGVDAELVT